MQPHPGSPVYSSFSFCIVAELCSSAVQDVGFFAFWFFVCLFFGFCFVLFCFVRGVLDPSGSYNPLSSLSQDSTSCKNRQFIKDINLFSPKSSIDLLAPARSLRTAS